MPWRGFPCWSELRVRSIFAREGEVRLHRWADPGDEIHEDSIPSSRPEGVPESPARVGP
jgi:hypothetical protein